MGVVVHRRPCMGIPGFGRRGKRIPASEARSPGVRFAVRGMGPVVSRLDVVCGRPLPWWQRRLPGAV
ncbi:hypothetical protein GCM10010358_63200 [Streptomyces minutiscleroticus]|uniref:Uncharacterized protein n=1 Tax=Streptomyces minutiscleroticus TaxID=68238 RepID=A0A918NW46_9ACTN|nr:hypothetical protein GCM10010358_63200 [Streptomyces minutiscleroticus]